MQDARFFASVGRSFTAASVAHRRSTLIGLQTKLSVGLSRPAARIRLMDRVEQEDVLHIREHLELWGDERALEGSIAGGRD
jgi:hypothetical protein